MIELLEVVSYDVAIVISASKFTLRKFTCPPAFTEKSLKGILKIYFGIFVSVTALANCKYKR